MSMSFCHWVKRGYSTASVRPNNSSNSGLSSKSAPKKGKTISLAGTFVGAVFWDCQGIMFVECVGKGKIILDAHNASLLGLLNNELQD